MPLASRAEPPHFRGSDRLLGRLDRRPPSPREGGSPEPWPPRLDAPERVGVLIRELGLTKEAYERCCGDLACEPVEDPDFQEAVDLVARALMLAPSIDHAGLEILREVARFPVPGREDEGALTRCST